MPHFSIRTAARLLALPLAAGAVLLAVGAHADEWCTLTLKDGRTLSGTLVDANDAQVVIRPDGGANMTFSRAEIAGVKYEKSARETYLEKRAALKGDDLAGRHELLTQFYYRNEKNAALAQFAKGEADQLAQDFPDSKGAKTLVRIIADRLAKGDDAGAKPEPKTTDPRTADPKASDSGAKGEDGAKPEVKKDEEQLPAAPAVGLLTAADQNLLRVYQLDFTVAKGRVTGGADKGAMVVVPKDTVEALFKNHADAEELAAFKGPNGLSRFRAMPPLVQLDYLFALKDRTLYPKVEVKTEPAALAAFRTTHHRHVAAHFSNWFAGQVPGLIAKPKSASNQAEAYTNFLALSLASVDGRPVINRDKPEDSLLLQWGLPRTDAKYPAPNIKGWKPCFSGPRDARFLELAKWIGTTFAVEGMGLPAAAGERSTDERSGGDRPGPNVRPGPGANRPAEDRP